MKKSTLITTIAMIVVVVVALSTATYAWFTSATKATATDSISVTSTSGWMLAGEATRNLVDDTDTVTFSYTSDIALTLPNGLYSPTDELTNKVSSNGASASFVNEKFLVAYQNGITLASTATITEGTDSYTFTETDVTKSFASYIKVRNSDNTPHDLVLTITVHTASENEAQLEAAQSLCAYITYNTGADSETAVSANTEYNYGTVAAGTDAEDSQEQLEVTRHHVNASTAGNGTAALVRQTTNETSGWISAASTTLATDFTGADAAITTGKYYQYKLTVPGIASNAEVNFAMYIWFDGWRIFSTATGTAANVYLAFGNN